jgi:anti-anti-sigma factor
MTLGITVTGPSVALTGEIDIQTAPSLRAELTELINATVTGDELRIDLSGVSIVDSSGLSVLIAAHKLATARDVRLVLTALPQHVSRTLSITGLDEVLEIA